MLEDYDTVHFTIRWDSCKIQKNVQHENKDWNHC